MLIWSYLCTNVAYFYQKIGEGNCEVQLNIELIACGLTLSIAGWIADVLFGWYKVISLSIWIMWAALMLATVSSLLLGTVDSYTSKIHSYVPRPIPSFSILHVEMREDLVYQKSHDQF